MKYFWDALKVNIKYNRGRITSPLAHILMGPLKNQFIASYPRSGSTWIRTMLTNVINPKAHSNPNIFNRTIPGTTLTRIWMAYRAPNPKILSTHSIYRRNIEPVVYVLRDGRDSMLSFYRYTTIRTDMDIDFDHWFSFYKKGWYGTRWDQHIEFWLTTGRDRLEKKMLIVRYEDCCADPQGNLEKICHFLKIQFSAKDINRAVELSSIENMRKWERKLVGRISNENASFYRGKMKAAEWTTMLNDQQRADFMRISENALRLGDYL